MNTSTTRANAGYTHEVRYIKNVTSGPLAGMKIQSSFPTTEDAVELHLHILRNTAGAPYPTDISGNRWFATEVKAVRI